MTAELAQIYSDTSPELTAIRQQSARDHSQLLARLNNLGDRLNELEPPFESWQAAIQEVQIFANVLERHELEESARVEMLMPAE